MRQKFRSIALAGMVLVADAAYSAPPPLQGTISVEPTAFEPGLASSMHAYVEAVGKALSDREFTVIEGAGHARLVADLSLSRVDVGASTTKVAGKGPAFLPGGDPSKVGASLSISLPTAKSKTVPLQQTRLEIRIKRRGEDAVMWHGAAITVRQASTQEGLDGAVASALSEALFRSYPAQSDNAISLP